jgi:hypothetical protein
MQGADAAACDVGLLLWAVLSMRQWRCSRPLLGPLAGAVAASFVPPDVISPMERRGRVLKCPHMYKHEVI